MCSLATALGVLFAARYALYSSTNRTRVKHVTRETTSAPRTYDGARASCCCCVYNGRTFVWRDNFFCAAVKETSLKCVYVVESNQLRRRPITATTAVVHVNMYIYTSLLIRDGKTTKTRNKIKYFGPDCHCRCRRCRTTMRVRRERLAR